MDLHREEGRVQLGHAEHEGEEKRSELHRQHSPEVMEVDSLFGIQQQDEDMDDVRRRQMVSGVEQSDRLLSRPEELPERFVHLRVHGAQIRLEVAEQEHDQIDHFRIEFLLHEQYDIHELPLQRRQERRCEPERHHGDDRRGAGLERDFRPDQRDVSGL